MRTTLLFLVLVASPVLAGQTVWVWQERDAKGDVITHYSDRPVPGARQMELSTTRSSDTSAPAISGSTRSSQPAASGPLYQVLAVSRPSDQETIANTGGQVTVTFNIEPPLQPQHALVLYLDGQPSGSNSAGRFELTNVPRGTHTAVAAVSDGRGTVLQESAPVTFFVRQESVAQPPVGPSLRPPPKPQPRPRTGNKLPTSQPTYAALNPSSTSSAVNPATNLPVVTKPATTKPSTPAPRQGK